MYSSFQLALKYLKYWLSASNGKGHGTHSPFVFDFIKKVLNDNKTYPEYISIESLRKKLLADHTPVPVEDYGAGSAAGKGSKSIAAIASAAAKPAKYAALLFRIARFYGSANILELGTSLGISTCYLAKASEHSQVVTGEGNFVLSSIAKNNFELLEIKNVRIVTGNFDNTLPQMAEALPHIDMAFIDGNHRKEHTIRYFKELLVKMSSSSVIILDDIHWSGEMEEAWKYIQNHPSSMLTIDLFFFGLVFFRPEFKVKQHFTIRF